MIRLLDVPSWSSAGPKPIGLSATSFTGAIQTVVGWKIASNPDRYVLFAGAVNGGVWRSDTFTGAMLQPGAKPPAIQWIPLADGAPTTSISSIALDPTDPSGNTLWAGTGQFSSSGGGGPAVGLLRTTNARDTSPVWTVLGHTARRPTDVSLVGQRISSVAPTSLKDPGTGQQIILVAAYDGQGILRSTDGGTTFQPVKGPAGPLSGFGADLIADPNDSHTFYAALGATYDDSQKLISSGGVFRSTDGGFSWTEIDKGIPQVSRSRCLKLAVFNNAAGTVRAAGPTVLYVGQADTSGRTNDLIGVFRSADPRAAQTQWTALYSDPDPTHIPNGLNAMQWPASALVPWFGMAVDPRDWNNLYLGGMSWLYRVRAVEQPNHTVSTNWAQWDTGAAFDHRSLSFLAADILLGTGDQGIFGLSKPANAQQWVSLNNSIAVTEFYAVAFDPTIGVLCGGAQDVGSPVQNRQGGWGQLPDGGGDGGLALVGSDGVYYYEVNGSFRRDINGAAVQPAGMPTVTGTHGAIVNPANPMQLLWAGSTAGGKLSESPDRGGSTRDITPGDMTGAVTAFAYGTDNPSAAYVGTSTGQLFLRQAGNGPPQRVATYPGTGSPVDDIAVDRNNWQRAVVISNDGRVLFTADAGAHWNNIRGNIGDVLEFMRKIEIVSVGADVVVLVAGDPPAGSSGVVRAINPDSRQPAPNVVWSQFGTGLPHVNVFDLHYCPPVGLKDGSPGGDLLIAGTLGRGAWTIDNVTAAAIVITGTVTDSHGNPVAGATVRVEETDAGVPGIYQTTTDAAGSYSITLYPGSYTRRYTIEVFGSGVQPMSIIINPIPRGVTRLTQNFVLNRLGLLTGSVTDTHAAPLAGATVLVGTGIPMVGQSSTFTFWTQTDATGRYSVVVDPPGQYHVVAVHAGFEDSDPASVTIALDTTTAQNFALIASQPGSIAGVVMDADTQDPIAGAIVEASLNPSSDSIVTSTNADGAYTLAGVPSGRRQVSARVRGRGYAGDVQTVRVIANQTVPANFALKPKPSRRGARPNGGRGRMPF